MTLPKFFRLLVFAAILIGTAVLLGSIGWPQPDRTREFCAVILAAILTSAFAIPRSTAEDRGMMTPPLRFFSGGGSWLGGGTLTVESVVEAITRLFSNRCEPGPRRLPVRRAKPALCERNRELQFV